MHPRTVLPLIVRIVQPSIAQGEKWDAEVRDRIFSTYLDMTAQAPEEGKLKPALIVWPETSVPFLFTERPDALAALGSALDDDQTLLAGAVRQEGNRNSRRNRSLLQLDDCHQRSR